MKSLDENPLSARERAEKHKRESHARERRTHKKFMKNLNEAVEKEKEALLKELREKTTRKPDDKGSPVCVLAIFCLK